MAFNFDTSHSSIAFSVRHMMISKARGSFDKWSGTVDLNEQNPTAAVINVTIDTASINTKDAQRDGHLRSPDFFDAEKYPTITFQSTKVELTDKENAKLTGDLTIHGVTKPVVLDVEYQGSSKSPWGTVNYGFSAKTKLNREDWGLTWNAALEQGGWLVGKDVNVEIEVELVQVPEQQSTTAAA